MEKLMVIQYSVDRILELRLRQWGSFAGVDHHTNSATSFDDPVDCQ